MKKACPFKPLMDISFQAGKKSKMSQNQQSKKVRIRFTETIPPLSKGEPLQGGCQGQDEWRLLIYFLLASPPLTTALQLARLRLDGKNGWVWCLYEKMFRRKFRCLGLSCGIFLLP